MPADWIDQFLDITSEIWSPESFRLWTAITVIASVLERRVYTETDGLNPLRPNIYTFLTGPPATGKGQSIDIARDLLGSVNGLFLGPDNPTKRSFLNCLEKAARPPINNFDPYCAMTALVPELSVLISKYEKDFVADLGHIFDNPPKYTAPRQGSPDIDIEAPTLNILAGTTPGALGDIMPDNAWDQGFCSRILFIYGAPVRRYRNIFKKKDELDLDSLQNDLNVWFNELKGPMVWDPDAQAAYLYWFNEEEMAPVPKYPKLVHYNGRRDILSIKLSMISAVSAGRGNRVTIQDWRRAKGWLLKAEQSMPEVFRGMTQKSDNQILVDMHHWAYTLWKKEGERALTEAEISNWFATRASAERIPYLIKLALQRGFLLPDGFAGKIGYKPNTPEYVERNSK